MFCGTYSLLLIRFPFDVNALILMQDEERLQKALHFANVCGAIAVTERGAIPALPTKEAVLKFAAK